MLFVFEIIPLPKAKVKTDIKTREATTAIFGSLLKVENLIDFFADSDEILETKVGVINGLTIGVLIFASSIFMFFFKTGNNSLLSL